MNEHATEHENAPGPRWQPLEAIDRRVLGVLIEKAKTTPDNYPLSLNGIRTGANQKSNRFPQMQLEDEQLEESLDRLRRLGAVSVIQGGSRVDKYRHLAYDWLGVDKVELAVMAELLLRGAQTIGELRGRAARMEPIKGLAELQPVLDQLEAKNLIIYLTPRGRGSVVTHSLFLPRELDKIRSEFGALDVAVAAATAEAHFQVRPATADATTLGVRRPATPLPVPQPTQQRDPPADDNDVAAEVERLRRELSELKSAFHTAKQQLESTTESLRGELDELNRQLGNQ